MTHTVYTPYEATQMTEFTDLESARKFADEVKIKTKAFICKGKPNESNIRRTNTYEDFDISFDTDGLYLEEREVLDETLVMCGHWYQLKDGFICRLEELQDGDTFLKYAGWGYRAQTVYTSSQYRDEPIKATTYGWGRLATTAKDAIIALMAKKISNYKDELYY